MIYKKKDLEKFKELIGQSEHIIVIQAEHVDADSLGSAIALEQILEDQGKQVTMYCANEVPDYLKHISGWDRVTADFPNKFDLSILVDSATSNQLEKTFSEHKKKLSNKPFVIIDHHASETARIEFATLSLIDPSAGASGQQIVELADYFGWNLTEDSAYALASSIKGDTLNLSSTRTTSRTFLAMAKLADYGVDFDVLRQRIEATQGLQKDHVGLRANAMLRTRFFYDDKIAITYFTQEEMKKMGDEGLVVEKIKTDLRLIKGVMISVTITERKGYANASMRANIPIARQTAEHFDGGGHDMAASCRFFNSTRDEVIEQMVPVLTKFIKEYEKNQA